MGFIESVTNIFTPQTGILVTPTRTSVQSGRGIVRIVNPTKEPPFEESISFSITGSTQNEYALS